MKTIMKLRKAQELELKSYQVVGVLVNTGFGMQSVAFINKNVPDVVSAFTGIQVSLKSPQSKLG